MSYHATPGAGLSAQYRDQGQTEWQDLPSDGRLFTLSSQAQVEFQGINTNGGTSAPSMSCSASPPDAAQPQTVSFDFAGGTGGSGVTIQIRDIGTGVGGD